MSADRLPKVIMAPPGCGKTTFLAYIGSPVEPTPFGYTSWQTKLRDFFDVLVFVVFVGFSVDFNYSKMANLGFRMDSNIFWNNFETSKKWTKYRPSYRNTSNNITKVLQTFYKHDIFVNMSFKC